LIIPLKLKTPNVWESTKSHIMPLARVSEEKEKGAPCQERLNSDKVPGTGIEPAHHC
jgi:hypothetical protein